MVHINGKSYVILRQMRDRLLLAEVRDGLHWYRMQAGLTQGKMAEQLQISQAALSKMENGEMNTRPTLLTQAAKILMAAQRATR